MASTAARHVEIPSAPGADAPPARAEGVAWRELRRGLWVGRAGDSHVGIIEQGRHFTLTDAEDHAHPGFPTLDAAQAATGPIDVVLPAPAAAREAEPEPAGREERPLITTAAVVVVSAVLATAFLAAVIGIVDLGLELLLIH